MARTIFTYILLILSCVGAGAQYITGVMEYRPAPGQFINSMPWGCPVSARSLVSGVNGTLSLGAFGGYVIFRFETAVENDSDNPFGIDFTIFGNPMTDWSEPGMVWVMEDKNENGLPDDTWFELAGSDYYFSSTLKDYRVTYTNPGGVEASDVPWEDHLGNSGKIRANSAHTQPYYPLTDSFPAISADGYTLTGTLIQGAIDVEHPPGNKSLRRAFGYADNQIRGSGSHTVPDNPYTAEVENSGGDAFDISWAVDREGNFVDLDRIHFVKVQNGILHEGGWLGELSTEITGVVDVAAGPGLSGNLDLLVIQDLPLEIDTGTIQMELFLFHMGRPVSLPPIQWIVSEEWAAVDENQVLSLSGSGPLTLSAFVTGVPSLYASVSTLVTPGLLVFSTAGESLSRLSLYPNPAREIIHITGMKEANLIFYDLSGKMVRQVQNYLAGGDIHIHDLSPGVYLIQIGEGSAIRWLKLLKQ
ncbi:MAG: T9SS type A sorting domain-containing protein [Bacteroidales bacterium]|nr:T9SS type A sorting domain-containing protein [Bacteroidales bacterium]